MPNTDDILSSGYINSPRLIEDEHGWDASILYNVICKLCPWKEKAGSKRGEVVKSLPKLAEITPYSVQQLKRIISILVDAGLIQKHSNGMRTGTRFIVVHFDEISPKLSKKTNLPPTDVPPDPQPEVNLPNDDASSLESAGNEEENDAANLPPTDVPPDPQPALIPHLELGTNEFMNKESKKDNVEISASTYIDSVISLYREICEGKVEKKFREHSEIRSGISKIKKKYNITLNEWKALFKFIVEDDFYSGKGVKSHAATLRWLVVTRPTKFMNMISKSENVINKTTTTKRSARVESIANGGGFAELNKVKYEENFG